jgi:hypothetical protein
LGPEAADISTPEKAAVDKAPQKDSAVDSAKIQTAGSSPKPAPGTASDAGEPAPSKASDAGQPSPAPASDGEAGATSVSEAVSNKDGDTEEVANGDMGAVVAADAARVDTTVAAEAANASASDDGNEDVETDFSAAEEGEMIDDEMIHVEENCCTPDQIPSDLVEWYNNGGLVFKP